MFKTFRRSFVRRFNLSYTIEGRVVDAINRSPASFRRASSRLLVVALVLMALLSLAGNLLAQAHQDERVSILSPEAITVTLKQDESDKTKHAASLKSLDIQNNTTDPVTVKFCALLEGKCDISYTFVPPDANIPAGLIATIPLAIETTVPLTTTQSGRLVLVAEVTVDNQTITQHLDSIAITLNPEVELSLKEGFFGDLGKIGERENMVGKRVQHILDNFEINDLISIGFAVALAAIIGAASSVVKKYKGLSIPALLKLRVGVATWKLEDSWISSLTLGLAILTGLTGIVPKTATRLTADNLKGLTALFAVLTAFATFGYNATVRLGPKKEEGKETYEKAGFTGWYLLASFLAIWSLYGQLGLQFLAVEELRQAGSSAIPGGFLILFQLTVLFLFFFIFYTTIKSLPKEIEKQDIEKHIDAFDRRRPYEKAIKAIKGEIEDLQERFKNSQTFEVPHDIEKFTSIIKELGKNAAVQEEKGKKIEDFEHLAALFNTNLEQRFNAINNEPDPDKAGEALLRDMLKDATEAIGLLKQTLPINSVVVSFYSSLWAPPKLRREKYIETNDKIYRHLRVACAQARSQYAEPDTILGPNEELFTNITTALTEMDEAFGKTGMRDPYYANMHKLFLEIAKEKWEVLPIGQLEKELCSITGDLQQVKRELGKLADENDGSVARALRPLSRALMGSETVPYDQPFPIDVKRVDKTLNRFLEKNAAYQDAEEAMRQAKAKDDAMAIQEAENSRSKAKVERDLSEKEFKELQSEVSIYTSVVDRESKQETILQNAFAQLDIQDVLAR